MLETPRALTASKFSTVTVDAAPPLPPAPPPTVDFASPPRLTPAPRAKPPDAAAAADRLRDDAVGHGAVRENGPGRSVRDADRAAAPPPAPEPPTDELSPPPEVENAPATLKPPLPPPPPTDWAKMPFERAPSVWTAPSLSTFTTPPLLATPPAPPTPCAALSPPVEPAAEIEKPPLPPPPPIDWARMPVEFA